MKATTRIMLLNLATGAAIAAAAALVMLPSVASAATTTVTGNANLRNAPNGAIIGSVHAGEVVDVVQCQGPWCEVHRPGPDGWVSSQYLKGVGGAGFQLNIPLGNGNGSVQFGVGTPSVNDSASSNDTGDGEVCFYDRSRFRGESFCMDEGESTSNLRSWADRISSFDNPDGLDVTVCTRTNLRGTCRTYSGSAKTLGDIDDDISSIEID